MDVLGAAVGTGGLGKNRRASSAARGTGKHGAFLAERTRARWNGGVGSPRDAVSHACVAAHGSSISRRRDGPK